MYEWIKALHVIAVIAWMAGMLYLPRLFVYHCDVADEAGHVRFATMERKLYGMGLIAMLGTWIFGIWMLLLEPALMQAHWLHAKLSLVLLLSGYQGWLKSQVRKFAARQNTRSARFWRFANEVPALFLVAIVILVIVKPF